MIRVFFTATCSIDVYYSQLNEKVILGRRSLFEFFGHKTEKAEHIRWWFLFIYRLFNRVSIFRPSSSSDFILDYLIWIKISIMLYIIKGYSQIRFNNCCTRQSPKKIFLKHCFEITFFSNIYWVYDISLFWVLNLFSYEESIFVIKNGTLLWKNKVMSMLYDILTLETPCKMPCRSIYCNCQFECRNSTNDKYRWETTGYIHFPLSSFSREIL